MVSNIFTLLWMILQDILGQFLCIANLKLGLTFITLFLTLKNSLPILKPLRLSIQRIIYSFKKSSVIQIH